MYVGNGKTQKIFIYYRPFLKEFLEYVSQKWEIGIFTASKSIYANAILQKIDPESKFINFRLFKKNCYRDTKNRLIKDLKILKNRDLKDIILVDNSINAAIYNLNNCVPIIPYYGDKNDHHLISLANYLDKIYQHDDLRYVNKKYFKFLQFKSFQSVKLIKKFIITKL